MADLVRFGVFCADQSSVQLCWGGLGPGRHTVRVGPEAVEVHGGPGTFLATGLSPSTAYDVEVDGRVVAVATTAPALPGPVLSRVATVSDCHIGEDGFGLLVFQHEPLDRPHYALRGLRAATEAAVAWGAELLVVKGDLTQRAQPHELEQALGVLAGLGVPVVVAPGNHEVKRGATDWAAAVRAAGLRPAGGDDPHVVELAGARVVVADTTIAGLHRGGMSDRRRAGIVDALAEGGGGPALLCLHHQLDPRPWPTCYPPGVPHREARALWEAVARANPTTCVTSGHTHRHRARRHGPLVATEVGGTKDFPGSWAGYEVHAEGIRQTAFHLAGHGTEAWLDRTRKAALGAWGRWSPGTLADRCVDHRWS